MNADDREVEIAYFARMLDEYFDDDTPDFAAECRRFAELFDELVPESGEAESKSGEVVRSVGRLADEERRMGFMNWGPFFRSFVDYLREHLPDPEIFDSAERARIRLDLDHVIAWGDANEPLDDDEEEPDPDPRDSIPANAAFARLIRDAVAYAHARGPWEPREAPAKPEPEESGTEEAREAPAPPARPWWRRWF